MEDEKFNKITTIIGKIMLVVLVILLLITLHRALNDYIQLYARVTELECKLKEVENDNKELWKNIDALSEDYTTIWVQLYGEDSWYEKPEDKEKVHNEIQDMGE